MKAQLFLVFLLFSFSGKSQDCNAVQQLTNQQLSDLSPYVSMLDTALKYEDFAAVDSLNFRIQEILASEAGEPDVIANYDTLTLNTSWLELPDAILLERALIDQDTLFYSELWKLAKGILPPNDYPHAIFLRTSAETAAGLLKIAERETDVFRQSRYRYWANRALDSLATMQLPNGAFPFPDLRDYNDPVFTSIIQNFLLFCGDDSVNVLQNGWIIDDKGTGEFKFDAGVIAEAYYDAYLYTGNTNYRDIVIAVADYMLPLHLNSNYNYNTFSVTALMHAYFLTGNMDYEQRASENLRYGLLPGQALNGRWADGHNANTRYHNLIIANCSPFMRALTVSDPNWPSVKTMYNKAVINLSRSSFQCESSTGFRWLTEAFLADVIPQPVKDSLTLLIGRHIQQAAIDGKYLNISVLGDYFELLDSVAALEKNETVKWDVYPNPAQEAISFRISGKQTSDIPTIQLYSIDGKEFSPIVIAENQGSLTIDVSNFPAGVYQLCLTELSGRYVTRIQIIR